MLNLDHEAKLRELFIPSNWPIDPYRKHDHPRQHRHDELRRAIKDRIAKDDKARALILEAWDALIALAEEWRDST